MTSTPSEPRLYDVWLMWVEFPDHPGIGKPRPVVITEVDGDLVSGIVAKITGNTDWDEAGDVPLLDWKAEGAVEAVARALFATLLLQQERTAAMVRTTLVEGRGAC